LSYALAAAERSLELNPNSVESMFALAEISRKYSLTADQQARTRMLQTAGKLLDDALILEPNNVDVIMARAEIFRMQKDIENAIALLIKYLQIDPECWPVHAIIGRLFFHKKDYVEAARYLINAIENRPTLPSVAGDLGFLYLVHNEYGEAAEFLQLALRLQPSDTDLKRHLAEAEFWKGNFESAGKLLEQTVASQPTLSHPKKLLAWLKGCSPFASFRDGEAGLALIEPFVDTNIDPSPTALEIQAVCYAEKGSFDKATEAQQQALDLIEDGRTLEKYSPKRLAALKDRLELFKRRKTYTMNDSDGVPINPPRRN
jgi:tetratricopeptide (TPR) repeat protein